MAGLGRNNIAGRSQLQWVVLLLVVAVVLPTVCLLWFMNQAVRNERLVVRQKLTDVYRGQLDSLTRRIDQVWSTRLGLVDTLASTGRSPQEVFGLFSSTSARSGEPLRGSVVIYDSNGALLYPDIRKGRDRSRKLPEQFNTAWNIEFVERDFTRAAAYYGRIAESVPDDYIGILASIAQIRCLRKTGEIEQAIRLCSELAYERNLSPWGRARLGADGLSLIAQARVLLIDLKRQIASGLTKADIQQLIDSATDYTAASPVAFASLPCDVRIFLLEKAVEIAEGSSWADGLTTEINTAKQLLSAERLSTSVIEQLPASVALEPLSRDATQNLVTSLQRILEIVEQSEWAERLRVDTSLAKELLTTAQQADAALENLPTAASFGSPAQGAVQKLPVSGDVYGVFHRSGSRTYLLVQTAEGLQLDLAAVEEELTGLGVSYRIVDGAGASVAGLAPADTNPFLIGSMGTFFPGWRLELYATEANIFEKAASRQIALYVWTGLLVIVLILVAGAVAGRAVTRQIRLNRMKNDFIATVSHELKTPLASIRVLIDTLLEGHIKDQTQAREYLQMTAKENERLSRMIENFLTFSRMERNKQAFEIVETSPAAIAADAAEAVRTKFGTGNCQFDVRIDDGLPSVRADHDAMVTVLVNLLDNAHKYSGDEKKVELSVFAEDNSVCFRVCDNGVGMPRRAARRIFNRFYQVDSSLSRRAEGCGLGLSIVKFIVDAHRGKISVESKIGKGSTFTIALPAGR